MPLNIGQKYTRTQIRTEVGGGDTQSYLPRLGGKVLCGCFDPRLNVRAPFEIDIGAGPIVAGSAKQFFKQSSLVPIFLKRGVDSWEYVGKFKANAFVSAQSDLFPINPHRRKDAIAVLYLEAEKTDPDGHASDDPFITGEVAIEGGRALATHLRRERSRQLTEAKRRTQIAEQGQLQCEGCDLTAAQLPKKIGEACFEVHHRAPLGSMLAASATKLNDLAILCANCHRLIHRTNPLINVKALRKLNGLV